MDGAWVCEAGVAPPSSGQEKMKSDEEEWGTSWSHKGCEVKHVYAPKLNESHISVTEDRDDSELWQSELSVEREAWACSLPITGSPVQPYIQTIWESECRLVELLQVL